MLSSTLLWLIQTNGVFQAKPSTLGLRTSCDQKMATGPNDFSFTIAAVAELHAAAGFFKSLQF